MKPITKEQIINQLREKQGSLSLRKFAVSIGVTAAYLSDIYRGRRDPGPTVLKFLRLKATRKTVVEYKAVK